MNRDEFIEHIGELAELPKDMAEEGALVVLSIFSHRLTRGESKDVAAQLPEGIKDLWDADTWATNYTTIRGHQQLDYTKRAEFYSLVQNEIEKRDLPVGADDLIYSVLHALKDQISYGEVQDISAQLPEEIRYMWESIKPC